MLLNQFLHQKSMILDYYTHRLELIVKVACKIFMQINKTKKWNVYTNRNNHLEKNRKQVKAVLVIKLQVHQYIR